MTLLRSAPQFAFATRPHPDVDLLRFAAARPDSKIVGQFASPAERTSALSSRDALCQGGNAYAYFAMSAVQVMWQRSVVRGDRRRYM